MGLALQGSHQQGHQLAARHAAGLHAHVLCVGWVASGSGVLGVVR